jgi:RNA polymerase sigma-70 factor (ECF subfamily)
VVQQVDGGQHRDRPKTLGDLLFASGPEPLPEHEWAALVQAIAGGDHHALHNLYGRTHRIVFTLVMRITHNRETAEELTVDVFHDVWRRASTYTPDGGSVTGWIMNQARSRAIDRVRFENRKKRVVNPLAEPPDRDAESGPHHAAAAREEEALLRDALGGLSQDERRAIETAFFSELTYAETASRLNEPVGTVKTRIRSGLAKLRRALAGKGVR